jgi:hypothetical protein
MNGSSLFRNITFDRATSDDKVRSDAKSHDVVRRAATRYTELRCEEHDDQGDRDDQESSDDQDDSAA